MKNVVVEHRGLSTTYSKTKKDGTPTYKLMQRKNDETIIIQCERILNYSKK